MDPTYSRLNTIYNNFFTPREVTDPSADRYAIRLHYLKTPERIRAAVLRDYGHAPSLEWIADSLTYRELRERREYRDFEAWEPKTRAKAPEPAPKPVMVRPRPEVAKIRTLPENPFIGRISTGARIIASVAEDFKTTPADLTGPARWKDYTAARAVVVRLLRDFTDKSYPEIGIIIGGRDHSTVINSNRKFDFYCKRTPVAKESYWRHLVMMAEAENDVAWWRLETEAEREDERVAA